MSSKNENPTPLHWVGGKLKLADTVLEALALTTDSIYCEPFLGGGAVFYRALSQVKHTVVADTCQPLLNFHRALNEDPHLLRHHFELLCQDNPPFASLPGQRILYYTVRDLYNARKATLPDLSVTTDSTPDYTLAALFLYINRFGYNGLYRENKKGGCNVPAGSAAKGEAEYLAVKRHVLDKLAAHKPVQIDTYTDWRAACDDAVDAACFFDQRVAFYFDPPYLGTFTGYGGDWNDPASTEELIRFAEGVEVPAGVVVLSNSPETETLLDKTKWDEVRYVTRSGQVNSDPAKRGRVKEILAVRSLD